MADKASAKPTSPLLQRRRSGNKRGGDRRWWDPTACSPVVITLLLLAAFGGWLLAGGRNSAEQPSCIHYAPRHCLFRVNTAKAIKRPPCSPVACAFDEALLDCPFAANGSFVRVEKADAAEACEDPFMEGARRPQLPRCGASCCAGDLPGAFRRDKQSQLPGALQWQPKAPKKAATAANQTRCSYHQYTGAEVLQNLQSSRTRLLVVGDSMQKQLHARIVHMFRGSRHAIDNRVFTMARYALCRAGDSYVIAPTYTKQIKGIRPEPTLEALPGFFTQPVEIPGCDSKKDPPAIIDSFYSAWYKHQPKHLAAYIDTLQPGERVILVIGVNFIDKSPEPRPEWLEYLSGIKDRVQIIILPTPTGLTGFKQRVEALQHRNSALRKWAAANGAGFVDFDGMSRDGRHPPHCVANIHWMCWIEWAGRKAQEGKPPLPAAGENVLRDARFGTPVASVYTTEDGQCHDEMNRNLAQIIFNLFMKSA